MSNLRFLSHRLLTGRTLSIALVGASLTLLSACGSTAADLAADAARKQTLEAQAAAAEECAKAAGPRLILRCLDTRLNDGFQAFVEVDFPGAPQTPAHGTTAPFVNGDESSNSNEIAVFRATGLTRHDLTGTNRGVSLSLTGEGEGSPVGDKAPYEFMDLHLARFSPVPAGAPEQNPQGKRDIPFLLIWQFDDSKGEKGIRFIAPGIERFAYETPEGETFPTPLSRAQYLNNILGSSGDNSNGQKFLAAIPGDAPSDNGQASEENPRPLPYTGMKPGSLKSSRLGQIRIDGSSNLWRTDGAPTPTPQQQAIAVDSGNERDNDLPSYDVELTFPTYHGTSWSLRYSSFIMMRAFYKGATSGILQDHTANPKTYINLFTYTIKSGATDTSYIADLLDAAGKGATGALYRSAFFAYGVAEDNQNKHYRLKDDDFRLTAIFNKAGGGTLTGTIKPQEATAGGTSAGINADTPFTAETPWGGSSPREIRLKDVQWTGYTGKGVEFSGTAMVTDGDGNNVPVYDAYKSGEINFKNFNGRFGGPKAEELVAEWRIAPDPTHADKLTTPTFIGGVSGQRYQTPVEQ